MKREFKVGDKVRVTNSMKVYDTYAMFMGEYINTHTKVWNYRNMIEESISDKVGEINALQPHHTINDTVAIVNLENCSIIISVAGLEFAEEQTLKTNRIERTNDMGTKAIVEYDIEDMNITFKVEGKLHLTPLLRILLHETELYDFTYKRVSPYKVKRVYDSDKQIHSINLDFIDIKDNYKQVHKVLIEVDKSLSLEDETHTMFIPDFLELCVERHILTREGDGYRLVRNLDKVASELKYLPCKPSAYSLINQGFIVPDSY